MNGALGSLVFSVEKGQASDLCECSLQVTRLHKIGATAQRLTSAVVRDGHLV